MSLRKVYTGVHELFMLESTYNSYVVMSKIVYTSIDCKNVRISIAKIREMKIMKIRHRAASNISIIIDQT